VVRVGAGRRCAGPALPRRGHSRTLGFATEELGGLGVRLISADRPGLGASDPDPGRTLLDWAEDVRELVPAGTPVVGCSQGAPFALACAAAGVAGPVAIVAGSDELSHAAFVDRLDPQLRGLVESARDDPAGALAAFSSFTADGLWEMVVDTSLELDRRLYTEPAFERAYRRALDGGFAQGPAGYARDTVLAMAPWPFALEDLAVPVDLWYGEHDASAVHSPDLGATLELRIPDARRHVLADAGGGILWTHGAQILTALLSRQRSARLEAVKTPR
jgi:pimeloyl-ACP methyl ester carboxylesterase